MDFTRPITTAFAALGLAAAVILRKEVGFSLEHIKLKVIGADSKPTSRTTTQLPDETLEETLPVDKPLALVPEPTEPTSTTLDLPEDTSQHAAVELPDSGPREFRQLDRTRELTTGKAAVEHVVMGLSDACFVYPLTSTMAYLGRQTLQEDQEPNAFGHAVRVTALRSQEGAAASMRAAAQLEGITASVLASAESLQLMSCNLAAIAESSRPCVLHVAAQTFADKDGTVVADDSNVMAVANTGACMLSSHTVQEAADLAVVAHLAAQSTSKPFVHFFDGVRTANEEMTIETLPYTALKEVVDIAAERATVGVSDIAQHLEDTMRELAPVFGRQYKLFDYVGAPDAELVIVVMGSAATVAQEGVERLSASGWPVGVIMTHLYRPWSPKHFLDALPTTAKRVAVLERTDEANTSMFTDVATGFHTKYFAGRTQPLLLSGRYGASLLPSMVQAVFDNMGHLYPRRRFSLQDCGCSTHATSAGVRHVLSSDHSLETPTPGVTRSILWESGSDTQNTLGREVLALMGASDGPLNVQAFGFVHTSGYANSNIKATSMQLRLSPEQSPSSAYPVASANCVWVARPDELLWHFGVLDSLAMHGAVVLDCNWSADEVVNKLPGQIKQLLARHQATLYVVDSTAFALDFNLPPLTAAALLFIEVAKTADHQAEPLLDAHAAATLVKRAVGAAADALDADVVDDLTLLMDELPLCIVKINYHAQEYLASPTTFLHPGCTSAALPAANESSQASDDEGSEVSSELPLSAAKASMYMLFKDQCALGERSLSGEDKVFVLPVSNHKRLTPSTYDRNIFHLEIDLAATGMQYEMGDALSVFPQNSPTLVEDFLHDMHWDQTADQLWAVNKDMSHDEEHAELITARQLFTSVLDVFGRPFKKFYVSLADAVTEPSEKATLLELLADESKLTARVEETATFADLLLEFPSAKFTIPDLTELVPRIKPRLYSIASSMKACPTHVDLLVVEEDWTTPSGAYKVGLCSRYLAATANGPSSLTCSVKPSLMKLPADPTLPVVMAGCGTGMAPFRAFLQEKHHQRLHGETVGPMTLFYGARYSKQEFLYKEDLSMFVDQGTLSNLRCAWSRDQKEKVYIQHKIAAEDRMMYDQLVLRGGYFYLCGQAGKMPADVEEALVAGFARAGRMSRVEAEAAMQRIKDDGRYVLEVY